MVESDVENLSKLSVFREYFISTTSGGKFCLFNTGKSLLTSKKYLLINKNLSYLFVELLSINIPISNSRESKICLAEKLLHIFCLILSIYSASVFPLSLSTEKLMTARKRGAMIDISSCSAEETLILAGVTVLFTSRAPLGRTKSWRPSDGPCQKESTESGPTPASSRSLKIS